MKKIPPHYFDVNFIFIKSEALSETRKHA